MQDLKILLLSEGQSINAGDADTANSPEKSDEALKVEFETFSASMRPKLKAKVEELENHKWKISVLKRNVTIEDSVKKFVHLVAGVKDFVSAAVSPNPHAQLAWSAVCFGLQVILVLASRPKQTKY